MKRCVTNCNNNCEFICSGCHTQTYCSKICQLKDWKNHKKLCISIKKCSILFEKKLPEVNLEYNTMEILPST